MACTSENREAIEALATGRLGADAAAVLLDHLETCADCSADFDLAADLVAAAESGDLAAGTPSVRLIPRRRWVTAVAAAAAVALIVVLLEPIGDGADPRRHPSAGDLADTRPLVVPPGTLRADLPAALGEDYRRAMDSYRAGDFGRAADALGTLSSVRPDDALVNLYLGVARLQLHEPHEALAPLERAIASGSGLLLERALWYHAQASLRIQDASGARADLERLVELAGDYELNARDLLRALDELERP